MNDLERADLPSFLPLFFVVEVHATTEKEVGARFSPLSLFFNRVVARLAPVQPKSSGSSRFPVNILTSLALPRYVAFRFVVKVTQGNGRGGVKRLACVFRQHRSASVLLF